ncbi:MAG: outer membrane protein TolC [Saprospiraceae bacterium]|jgi:outer membrane protein TolC
MYYKRLNYLTLKKLSLLSFFVLITVGSFAQMADFNKIVPGEDTRLKTFEDYLVQLAWINGPQGKAYNSRQKIAELEVDLSQREWMDNASLQWNINEISLSNIIYPENELFVALPVWNVTATIELGTVFNRKKKIDISKQKLEITKQNIDLLKMQVRAVVLERYYKYLTSLEILKVATEAVQDATENHILLKELFKEDKADFEELNRASLAFTNAKRSKLEAEMEIQLSKIALEEVIGVKYEEAQKYGSIYKK